MLSIFLYTGNFIYITYNICGSLYYDEQSLFVFFKNKKLVEYVSLKSASDEPRGRQKLKQQKIKGNKRKNS